MEINENGKPVKLQVIKIIKYDSNGNEVHRKSSKGEEEWREYDDNV